MNVSKITSAIGALLLVFGLFSMIGLYGHLPIFNVFPVGFNFSLLISLSGLALLLPYAKVQIFIGILIAAFSGVILSQNIFDYIAHVDDLFITPWLPTLNPHPGRLAVNTSIVMILAGCSFIFLPYSNKKFFAFLTQFCIFGVVILGLTALTGYLFGIDVLYAWQSVSRMALSTALCSTLLGIGLWIYWSKHPYYQTFYAGKEDQKVILLSSIIIISVGLLAGMVGFSLSYNDPSVTLAEVHHKAVIIITMAITSGIILLYWLVVPLIRNVMRSQKTLQMINRQLDESENRFRSAFDFAAIGMALISLDEVCIKVNKAMCSILGMSELELLNTDLRRVIYPEDVKKDLSNMEKLLKGHIHSFQSEQRFFNKKGDIIWAMVNMSLTSDDHGKPLYYIFQMQNISAEKSAEDQLRKMAYHDPLTGLANRNRLEQYLNQLVLSTTRQNPEFALIILDLDHFKNINDTIGHDAGDMLLKIVAERLKTTVRDTDLVARVGGDEFVLVITFIKRVDSVAVIAQKILHNLLKPIVIKGHEIFVTTSIGVSFYPHDGQDIQTLMKNADLALYRAKEQGRNNYQFCTPEMTEKAQEKMVRQSALNNALVKNEFELFYQPKMHFETNKICGVEALLRWRNPKYSMVSVEEIISLAEESGLIISLSEWILRTACKQVNEWHQAGFQHCSLAINLSPRQFKQANFVQSILQVLSDTHFPAEKLELEITESLIMQDPENTLHILQELKNVGAKLAVDDFGTGYSSLSYLQRFSVDKIKIDRTFMRQISLDERSKSIVTAMIAMARKLGIETSAEGVETREQFEFLLKENCTEMQGYYLSRPVPVDVMTKFLESTASGVKVSALYEIQNDISS